MSAARWHHASLTVSDIDPAIAFFRAVFGLEPVVVERGLAEDIAALAGRDGLLCDFAQLASEAYPLVLEVIAFRSTAEETPAPDPLPWRPGAGHVAFHVDDLEATLALAERHGARRLGRVIAFPGGRSVYCEVPGGAFIELEWLERQA